MATGFGLAALAAAAAGAIFLYGTDAGKKRRAQIKSWSLRMKGDILDRETVAKCMQGVDRVLHLAALAGVRYAFDHPDEYIDINITGFFHVLDEVRKQKIPGLIYASSSSVYGGNDKLPASEEDRTDNQLSLYGMNKKDNELMAHTYHHLYGTHVTGLRFFTVYGRWGRPDMALFLFTDAFGCARDTGDVALPARDELVDEGGVE